MPIHKGHNMRGDLTLQLNPHKQESEHETSDNISWSWHTSCVLWFIMLNVRRVVGVECALCDSKYVCLSSHFWQCRANRVYGCWQISRVKSESPESFNPPMSKNWLTNNAYLKSWIFVIPLWIFCSNFYLKMTGQASEYHVQIKFPQNNIHSHSTSTNWSMHTCIQLKVLFPLSLK